MFLRAKHRFKNGKWHRYFSVVESRRVGGPGDPGRVTQRQVLYLGEINDTQEAAWRKTLEAFDEDQGEVRQFALFPDDRPVPPEALNALSLRLSELELRRPRSFGDCWLGLLLWRELELDRFWALAMAGERGDVPWEKVLAILAINRLVDPGSEWRVHRQWFLTTALDELLEVDFAAAGKDRLYRCLDRVLEHKSALCQHLVQRWRDLFNVKFDLLLYDLSSTYFEGTCDDIPKARHGYSRDGRGDCRQVVIALVVTPDGLPLAYEVMAGNTSDRATLRGFLAKIEQMYGKTQRIWVMDRGIPDEATLEQMRQEGVHYLVGTPRTMLNKFEKQLLDKPWEAVHAASERSSPAAMQVKLLRQEEELYVLAQSQDRKKKENAMRRRKLKKLVAGLNRLRRPRGGRTIGRDQLLAKVAVLRKEAGRVAVFVKIQMPREGEAVNRQTFQCCFDRAAWRQAMQRDGSYLLRGFLPAETADDAPALWRMYMQLVQVEEAFRSIKSDIAVRPIWHRTEPRVEAHILVAFLGYCLLAHLRMKLRYHAPGPTPREAIKTLAAIRMIDVCIPTKDGRELIMSRHTEPEAAQRMVLEKLGTTLPPQPPPRIRNGGQVQMPQTVIERKL